MAAIAGAIFGGPRVSLSGHGSSDFIILPGTASAGFRFDNDGNVYDIAGAGSVQVDTLTDWIRPASFAPGSYEVRLTVASGSAPTSGPAVNTWHALTSDRVWSLERSTAGTSTGTWTVEIRDGGGIIRATGTYTVTADAEP